MAKYDGGPAFPIAEFSALGSEGLSIRDWFVGHAPPEPQGWFFPTMRTDRPEPQKPFDSGFPANATEIIEWDKEREKQRMIPMAPCLGRCHDRGAWKMSKAAMENRQARCICGKLEPSSTELAFFVYRGEGSGPATVLCKCGYTKHAHWLGIGCKAFEPHGPYEYDSYYCGCQGWD